MRLTSILGISVFLVLCMCGPYSGEVMADNDNQVEAEKLLRQAAEQTDIRSPGSHAFHLTARVKVFDKRGQTNEGTYDLVWKTPTDWQDKLRIGDFSQERTAVVGKLFVDRNTSSLTLEVYQLLKLLEFPALLRYNSEAKAQKLRERTRDGVHERVIEVGYRGQTTRDIISLDGSSPIPTLVGHQGFPSADRFENYVAFNGHQFPRTLTKLKANRPLIQVHQVQVQELTDVTIANSTIVHSPDARWYLWCPHPEPITMQNPGKIYPIPWPLRGGPLDRPSAIYGVVGTDGGWHNLAVVKSAGKEVDEFRMNQLRQDRFSPARCGEVPVLQEFVMEFESQ
jgi:hypothetical protein